MYDEIIPSGSFQGGPPVSAQECPIISLDGLRYATRLASSFVEHSYQSQQIVLIFIDVCTFSLHTLVMSEIVNHVVICTEITRLYSQCSLKNREMVPIYVISFSEYSGRHSCANYNLFRYRFTLKDPVRAQYFCPSKPK